MSDQMDTTMVERAPRNDNGRELLAIKVGVICALLMSGTALGVCLFKANGHARVLSRGFILQDDAGRICGQLMMAGAGQEPQLGIGVAEDPVEGLVGVAAGGGDARLMLTNSHASIRAAVARSTGSEFRLEHGRDAAGLRLSANGTGSGVRLYDAIGRLRGEFALREDGTCVLRFYDGEGAVEWSAR